MESRPDYHPSQTLPGDPERLRQHSFTRWMSRDLLQAAADFCKNLGLTPIYAECSPDGSGRYLFWKLPPGARTEVRSGRTEERFRVLDQANIERGWPLLSLHMNENDVYSAVWISTDHYQTAVTVLASYGITPADRQISV